MDKFIDIQVQVDERVLDKYLLYYPSREAVADENNASDRGKQCFNNREGFKA